MARLRIPLLVITLIISITFNVLVFASTKVFAAANAMYEMLTDRPSAASLIHPKDRVVKFKGKKMRVADAVGTTTQGIKRRALRTSTRSVSSIAVEAIPYAGIAAIVGVTAWEIKDLCDTVKDVEALNHALNPDHLVLDNQDSVCSVTIPSKSEILAKAQNASEDLRTKVSLFLEGLQTKE
ncbi:MAG TPA: hypothetical protein DCW94_06650 [Porticoccaceae bacterium]|nr:hypothetical protein [Porticoccaceae bacterium]